MCVCSPPGETAAWCVCVCVCVCVSEKGMGWLLWLRHTVVSVCGVCVHGECV